MTTLENTSMADLFYAILVILVFAIVLNVISLGWREFMAMLEPKKVIKKAGGAKCPFCQYDLNDDWNYCPRCGQMLSWSEPDEHDIRFKDVLESFKKKGGKK